MAIREPVDALLDELSQSSHQHGDNENPNDESVGRINEQLSTPPQSTSPASVRRQVRIARILSSSSLRKRQIKSVPCKYCMRFKFGRNQIEQHLIESTLCCSLYLREYKVRCINGILSKMFRCFACGEQGAFQLKRHIGWRTRNKDKTILLCWVLKYFLRQNWDKMHLRGKTIVSFDV